MSQTELERAVGEILIDKDTLAARVAELGAEVSTDYEGRDLLLIGVLKGAVFFMADLMRHLTVPCEVDFMAISSYGDSTDSSGIVRILKDLDINIEGRDLLLIGVLKGAVFFMADLMRSLTVPCEIDFMAISSYGASTDSSGVVRILKDLDINIEGRHVLVVEDIIDSGLTLSYLMRNLESREPATLEVCALMTKPERREIDVPVRYVGFEIPNKFVVGYGLDFGERYRNLPYVGVLDEHLLPSTL